LTSASLGLCCICTKDLYSLEGRTFGGGDGEGVGVEGGVGIGRDGFRAGLPNNHEVLKLVVGRTGVVWLDVSTNFFFGVVLVVGLTVSDFMVLISVTESHGALARLEEAALSSIFYFPVAARSRSLRFCSAARALRRATKSFSTLERAGVVGMVDAICMI
jgi:hypothetical protein